MVTLTCECCGFSQTFESAEQAYFEGWDEPENMPSWPVSCPLCPGVAAMGLIDHGPAHARWDVQGRPADFKASVAMGDLPDLGPMPQAVASMLRNLGVDVDKMCDDLGVSIAGGE